MLGLIHHLVLHFPDLLPRATAILLPGGPVLESTGLRVCHRHRKAPLLTVRRYHLGAAQIDGVERFSGITTKNSRSPDDAVFQITKMAGA
jgi:hypothetical protein